MDAVPFCFLSFIALERYLIRDVRPFAGGCLEGVCGKFDIRYLALIETAEHHGADISVKLDL